MPRKKVCSFLLKEPSSSDETPINFFMTCPDRPVKRSVLQKVAPSNWDFKEQRPKKGRELTKLLDEIEQMAKDTRSACRLAGKVISAQMIEEGLNVILQDTGVKKAKEEPREAIRDMFEDYRALIEGMKDGTVVTPDKKKKRYAPATIKQFASITNVLETFYKEKNLQPGHELISMITYEAFIVWCHSFNHSTNYIGTIIKRWKILAKIARKKGWHSNTITESDEFVKITEETDDIFLTDEKIQAIAKASVGLPGYDIARDWFVLDCYLGLRVSDLLQLTEKDFEGDFFQLINQKTGAKVAIPLNPTVRKIIKRYKGLPPYISDVTLNEYIKEVAKRAKLNATFVYTITKGGKLQTIRCKEWEMVSSHTCRRSFITNLLRLGVPPHQVMTLAGITDYDTLKRYFKQSAMEVAEDVKTHPFFAGK